MKRQLLDKILRSGVRLCMLTAVAFTVTACYGAPNNASVYDDEYVEDTALMEEQIGELTEEMDTAAQQ